MGQAYIFGYWFTIIRLLKMGLSWEAIQTLTTPEVDLILAIQEVIQDKEEEEQARVQTQMMARMPKF